MCRSARVPGTSANLTAKGVILEKKWLRSPLAGLFSNVLVNFGDGHGCVGGSRDTRRGMDRLEELR